MTKLAQWCLRGGVCAVLGTALLRADVPARIGSVPPIIQQNYDAAVRRYQTNAGDDHAAWELARACFDRAEFVKDDRERAEYANEGINACNKLLARSPNSAEGHYYLGMDLAQLARTKLLGALPLVRQMETEWTITLRLDDKVDHAGPDRYIGLLYRDAPGPPLSIGNAGKARRHLQRAVDLDPVFPENYLNLIETYLMWKKVTLANAALDKLRRVLPEARLKYTGEYWNASWLDWNDRLEKIEKTLSGTPETPPAHRR